MIVNAPFEIFQWDMDYRGLLFTPHLRMQILGVDDGHVQYMDSNIVLSYIRHVKKFSLSDAYLSLCATELDDGIVNEIHMTFNRTFVLYPDTNRFEYVVGKSHIKYNPDMNNPSRLSPYHNAIRVDIGYASQIVQKILAYTTSHSVYNNATLYKKVLHDEVLASQEKYGY